MLGKIAAVVTTKVAAFVAGFMLGQFTLFFGMDARVPLYMIGFPVCADYVQLVRDMTENDMKMKFIGFKRLADRSSLVIFHDELARWRAFNVYALPRNPACPIAHGG